MAAGMGWERLSTASGPLTGGGKFAKLASVQKFELLLENEEGPRGASWCYTPYSLHDSTLSRCRYAIHK